MSRKKITFIGAGSYEFTRDLVKDILTFPALLDVELCLMDINEERLKMAERAVNHIVKSGNYPAVVTTTMDRKDALKGSDGVLCTILCGELPVWRHDIEIPKKYGVNINIGDTRGPAAIFRFLRTAPAIMDICRDMERFCPGAIFLNYTNPMAMLCRLMQGQSNASITGLCHSVQATSRMLASWIGAPYEEISYLCAGINHQAHYLRFEWNKQDAYPLLYKKISENSDIYNNEKVRNEMFLALGYYVTESSGHNSEYVAWFRKREDLMEKYCKRGAHWNPGEYAFLIKMYTERELLWRQQFEDWMGKPADLARGFEYASNIFNAVFGDYTPFEFNGNVRNYGIIDNLPDGCCVEVPVIASRRGLDVIKVGKLPPQLALLNSISAQIEEMAVEGCLAGDPTMIYQAICFDPLTSAVLSLKEIQNMVDEMFEHFKGYLPQFKHLS